jgi:hypothetical protein
VDVLQNDVATEWFGRGLRYFNSFHWHGEAFTVPPGATRIAASPYCENQAFAMGPHLGMQCHVEMTPDLIRAWCDEWGKEVERLARSVRSVQTPGQMLDAVDEKVRGLHAVADVVYDRWTAALERG